MPAVVYAPAADRVVRGQGWTALMLASQFDSIDFVRVLVNAKADVNAASDVSA
jgi:hypothetical protein